MKITVMLQAGLPGDPETQVHVSGETVTVDGVALDLAGVDEGGQGIVEPAEGEDSPFVGPITREAGEISLVLRFRFDPLTAIPNQPAVPIVQVVTDGALPDPVARIEEKGGLE